MVDKSRMTLQKLARWHPAQSNPAHDRKGSAALWEGSIQPLDHEDLKQGALYIIKIHKVSVGLFQGWNDDMCCFAVLRSENGPLRWSQARYLPGDFDAFDAFDEAGNPPVHLWTRYLHVDVPVNWFVIFEEARRKQREWAMLVSGQKQQHQHHHHHQHQHQHQQVYHHDPSSTEKNTDMLIGGYPNHQRQQQSYEDYSDLDNFSAAPSQSLQSERVSSISSLHLPSDAIFEEITNMPPVLTPLPHSPIAANVPSSLSSPSSQTRSHFNETNQPHLSHARLQPSDKYNAASSVQPMVTRYNETNHQISPPKQHTTSSLPDVTTKTQIPTTLSKQTPVMRSLSPASAKQLEMISDEFSFPHDDDQFSIHSDYQPNTNAPESITINDQYSTSSSMTRKKRSIKKILSRSSTIAK